MASSDIFKITGKIVVDYADAIKGINKTSSSAKQTSGTIDNLVSSAGKVGTAFANNFTTSSVENASSAVSDLSDTIAMQETDLANLKTKYQDLYITQGKNSDEAKECATQIEDLSTELQENKDKLSDAEEAADEYDQSLDDLETSAGEAQDGFTTFKGVLSNLVANGISFAIQKCGELVSAIGDVTKSCVDNYADYEQLVGGVETLFGSSADQLIEYAEGAYQTAGLSSNDYMDTATSFAASLIQGLGDDTDAAVELTNQAITDMADNANKMGTDISSIQDAYQGFAKQNYTMLDNLKLGYGGTQTEMIRLINDSGILDEKITSLDGITFDQMIQAIHNVQDDLGITGTTAEEAGTTISGSWSSIQAKFENIKTKLGEQLAPVIMDALKKISKWLEKIDWDDFADKVGKAFDGLSSYLMTIDWDSTLDTLLSFIEDFGGFVTDMADKLPTIIDNISKFVTMIINNKDAIIALAAGYITYKTTMAVVNTVTQLVTASTQALNAAQNGSVIGVIVTLVSLLVTAIIYLWQNCESFRTAVKTILEKIKNAFSTAVSAITGFFSTAVTKIKNVWSGVTNFFKSIWTGIKKVFTNVGSWFKNIFSKAWTGIKKVFSGVKNFFKNVWDNIKSAFGSVANWFKNIFSKAWEAVKNVFSAGGKVFSGIKDGISDVFKKVVNKIISGINKVITIPFDAINGMLDKLRKLGIGGAHPFKWLPTLEVPQIPELEEGAVLERGQIGLLEGNGAEAVVPLEKNKKWIANVAADMDSATGNNEALNNIVTLLSGILSAITTMDDGQLDKMKEAISDIDIQLNNREIGRLVRKYA